MLDETQAQLAEVIKLMSVGEAESEAVNRLNAAHKQLTARLSRATTNAADAVRGEACLCWWILALSVVERAVVGSMRVG